MNNIYQRTNDRRWGTCQAVVQNAVVEEDVAVTISLIVAAVVAVEDLIAVVDLVETKGLVAAGADSVEIKASVAVASQAVAGG